MPLSPLTRPAARDSRRSDTSRDSRRRWAVVVSILLHLVVLGIVLTARRAEPPVTDTPSYDLVFEPGSPPIPPDQALEKRSEPPAETLQAAPLLEAPASPNTTEPPPPVLVPLPEPGPTPESPPDPEAVEPSSEPEPTLAPQATPAPGPPAVRLPEPGPAPDPFSPKALAPELPALVPPPPLPPVPPRPRQQAQQRPPPGAFPPPIDLNFGPAASRAPLPRIARSSRAIDLSLGTPKLAPDKSEPFFKVRAANIGADWRQTLSKHWLLHRYYPRQAAENSESGTVDLDLVVNRQGRVESVEIKSRSGSPWLDMAAVATWRGAQLAPLPYENTDTTITVQITITYTIIR